MILFLIFLNLLLPLIGYGIAGVGSMAYMIVIVIFVDYVAVCELLQNRRRNGG
jgi:hypothetical protein